MEKRADRPHRFTIRLAILSPLLAVVAAIISIQSIRTSDRAMKVGQRSYLVVTNGKLMVEQPTDVTDKRRVLTFGGVIRNLGNTPATIVNASVTYPSAVPDFQKVGGPYKYIYNLPREISPKTDVVWHFQETGLEFRTDAIVALWKIDYRDVFDDVHEMRWCWLVDRKTEPYPTECDVARVQSAR